MCSQLISQFKQYKDQEEDEEVIYQEVDKEFEALKWN